MKRRSVFSVASLLAAGLTPPTAISSEEAADSLGERTSLLDRLEAIVQPLDHGHRYTLAGHSSHRSHHSHHSHHSHAGYRAGAGRNEESTPRSTILPSSPAIARKLKVLPGNSAKFRNTVAQVQVGLATKGYDVGKIDGQAHARTIAAVYTYQRDAGFIPSGRITSEVLGSLGIAVE